MTDTGLRDRLARLLYSEIRECSGGYVDPIEHDQPLTGPVTVDGRIDFTDLADAVIEGLGLREDEDADFTGGARVRYVTDWMSKL